MLKLSKPQDDWGPASVVNKHKRIAAEVPLTPKPCSPNGGPNFFSFDQKTITLTTIPRTKSMEDHIHSTEQSKRRSNISESASLSKSESTLPDTAPEHVKLIMTSETKSSETHV